MRNIVLGAAIAAALIGSSVAVRAEPYVDYTPQKGYWNVTAIEVDPNHVDEYLTGLRQSQVTGFEVLKKRGFIDDYRFMLRKGYVKGNPNVLIMTHVPTSAMDDPDQARDKAIDDEIYAAFSKEKGQEMVRGYEKYRTFLDEAQWTTVLMNTAPKK